MKHQLPELPYRTDALAPAMSAETFEYHYGKHLKTYIDNLNDLIEGTEFENMPLEEIVKTSDGGIFNNAAQTWNHTFFFTTLTPTPVSMPESLAEKIAEEFGSMESFKEQFMKASLTLFGSGWVWLAEDASGRLRIVQERNAGNPMTSGMTPLLVVDVWEHAYYIDYRNARASYLEAWWSAVDWDKVAARVR